MATYVICDADGAIYSVGRIEELPTAEELAVNTPDGGFVLDLTGQDDFEAMEILDIHNGYKSNAKKTKLIKK